MTHIAPAAGRPPVEFVITDLKMDGIGGLDVVKAVRERDPDCPVMIVTAFGTVETAVEAMRLGALDFLQKPFAPEVVRLKVARALELRGERRARERAEAESAALRADAAAKYRFDEIVGETAAMRAVFATIEKVAPTDASVYIYGESGTGKELVARAIHARSKRAQGPFVKVNCGALTETLLESELFGHEKGAFTGAVKRKLGRFELADKGTLFLDEIGDVTPGLQLKLLRVLQERDFERVGGEETIKVDVRVLSATHRDIQAEVAAGRFREDLFYRLHVVPCTVPALRERKDDIPRLCAHFIAKLGPAHQPGGQEPERRGARPAVRLRLAGQRARAGERHRAGAGVRGRGGDRRRRAAGDRARRLARQRAGAAAERDVAAGDPRGSRTPADPARLRQERGRQDRDGAPARDQDQRALLQAGEIRHRRHREPERKGGGRGGRSRRRCSPTVRRARAAAPGAIVRADPTLFARRTAIVLAVAIVAGIGVVLGCASEASARRGAARIGARPEWPGELLRQGVRWRRTASGERYDPNGMTAAHKTLPFGTRVRVTRRPGGPSVVAARERPLRLYPRPHHRRLARPRRTSWT